jgi:hypothetical protein
MRQIILRSLVVFAFVHRQVAVSAPLPVLAEWHCPELLDTLLDNELSHQRILKALMVHDPITEWPSARFYVGKIIEHILQHPEWPAYKRAKAWTTGVEIIRTHQVPQFVSKESRGSKNAYVFQGHLGELIIFTINGQVFRGSMNANLGQRPGSAVFDEALLEAGHRLAPQYKIRELRLND